MREGADACLLECAIRSNGAGRLVRSTRRGERTHGDDAAAGVVVHEGSRAHISGGHVSGNVGAGLFAHAHAHVKLSGNVFRDNRGDDVRSRPSSRLESSRIPPPSSREGPGLHMGRYAGATRGSALPSRGMAAQSEDRPITPAIVRRQRVPFDWTVGRNVSADDKTLDERASEMRAQYRAMSSDKEAAGLAMLPNGMDASTVCMIS